MKLQFKYMKGRHLPKSWAIMLALASGNRVISTGGAHLSSSTSVSGIPDMFPVI